MSLVIAGNAANVTAPLAATITGIAISGGLWRVTTSSAHHYGEGDTVRLVFTASAVNYDFTCTITIVDATHFDITSPTSGTFTGGTGTATDLSLTPQIQVPTDGDAFSLQLSGMLSALQALCDRTQALKLMMVSPTLVIVDVLATAVVPIPGFTKFVIAEGCGGGGGGGGGGGAINAANTSAVSGGGGGGAKLHRVTFAPTVDHVITVTIGAGGALGGAGTGSATVPTAGFGGVDGGDTTIVDTTASVTLAVFKGGGGGLGGYAAANPEVPSRHAAGGRSQRRQGTGTWGTSAPSAGIWLAKGDGYGGDGLDARETATYSTVNAGWENTSATPGAVDIIGGTAGTPGTVSGGNVYGGGGGGGGGAGPYDSGAFTTGHGGNGGNGLSGGAGGNGANGTSSVANSGAGGGGGGGGGSGVTPGNGGTGGNGGSGRVRIYYYLPGGLT